METASVTAQGVGPDSQALRTGSSLMVIGAVAFIGYAILFFILNFTSFLELGIGDEQVDVGKDEIEAFSPSLHDYVSHLHIAVSGFIAATGLAVAALAVGAEGAWICIKAGAAREVERMRQAMQEMAAADVIGDVPVELVTGPDEYLFGEEKALLEVIEGNPPLPRTVPPWMEGLFRRPDSPNPTVVNNPETLANVPYILREGAEWFRSIGTEDSPGTMLLTLCGDVRYPGVYELPMGFSLRELIHGIGGGAPEGRTVKAVFPGASSTIVSPEQFDTPMSFDAMKAVGSALGSGAFVVYDDSACIVRATLAFSRFLYVESCAQCPACKHGTGQITELLERIDRGEGSEVDVDTILARSLTVTDAQRCALPTGETLIAQSAIQVFGAEFVEHYGRPCPRPREIPVPKIVDVDEHGAFVYDDLYRLKQPDWTYADEEDRTT